MCLRIKKVNLEDKETVMKSYQYMTLPLLVSAVIVSASCARAMKVEKARIKVEQSRIIGMPNPASVNCANLGGKSRLSKSETGETGWCEFPNGQICAEWPLYRDNKCVAPTSEQLKALR